MEVRCSMESYDKVRQRAMYYSLDRIMYRSMLLHVLRARMHHVVLAWQTRQIAELTSS